MDLTESIAPRSDQINADDLIGGPRTVTIIDVTRGSAEQPVHIVTEEFGVERPYKPSKSMRRILVAAWGPEASAYIGRRVTIYRDAEITFGPDKVGGIRISHLSDLDKRMEIALTVKRGKRSRFAVDPLPDQPAGMTAADAEQFEQRISGATSLDDLDAIARDLKARDLGAHRKHLQSLWAQRKSAVEAASAPAATLDEDAAIDGAIEDGEGAVS